MAKVTTCVNYRFVMACGACGWFFNHPSTEPLCPRCGQFEAKWQPGKITTTTTHHWYGNKTVNTFEPHPRLPSIPPGP